MDKFEKNEMAIHLDVGHESIGWSVSRYCPGSEEFLRFIGTGVVLFPADDCLANHRRAFRRQRRHIRATRQRIARMKALLLSKGVLTPTQLESNQFAAPWKLAASVLSGGHTLNWQELWYVLRWYAHNRGYDGNVLSSLKSGRMVNQEDIEKNAAARALMKKYGTGSMAETMCKYLDVDPCGDALSSMKRFKELGVSFDRSVVVNEVQRILKRHIGKLRCLDEDMVHILLADPVTELGILRMVHDLPFSVPARYVGGLLFGQLSPRFDNRIIGTCPVSGAKLPIKTANEFLLYRWAMMLSNTRVGTDSRRLSVDEINHINCEVRRTGGFSKSTFRKLVVETTGEVFNNIDALMTAPDADKSLVRFPGLYELTRRGIDTVLDREVLWQIANRLYKGKGMKLRSIREFVPDEKIPIFDELFKPAKQRGKKRIRTFDEILDEEIRAELPTGRAPYSRDVLTKAAQSVFAGKDPREKGGILYRDATIADILPENKIDSETNNHLVRHRIKILLRLLKDIVHDYAENNRARIAEVTIETARDLKDLSGQTHKEIESEMRRKTQQHQDVAQKLAEHLHCSISRLSAGLIRKARIAEDMNYTCPYTGARYDIQDVVSKNVDLDHILPRSQRETDSLDSLVLTFTEVNRMKGNRTGLEFVREFGGQRVCGRENLQVHFEQKYRQEVEAIKATGYIDDRRRVLRRKEKLLQLKADEVGMTEGMLTRTSYITTLASKAILGYFDGCGRRVRVVAVPGRVTAAFRKQWNLLGILSTIDPRNLDQNGNVRLKSEIRDITHMHHAVDAITLGLAATLLPSNGTFWAMVCKRRVSREEAEALKGLHCFRITAEGEPRLAPLPKFIEGSIRTALSEQRVIVHVPQRKNGLKVEQLTWGVERIDGDTVCLRQRQRDAKTGKITVKPKQISMSQSFGLNPSGSDGKLKQINGVLLHSENFGVALTNPPRVLRFHKVWGTLASIGGGKIPEVIRKGNLISVKDGNFKGVWCVASVKDNRGGIALDLRRPFAVKTLNKVDFAKINVRLSTLMINGLEVLKPRYTGVALCPITSSTYQQKV